MVDLHLRQSLEKRILYHLKQDIIFKWDSVIVAINFILFLCINARQPRNANSFLKTGWDKMDQQGLVFLAKLVYPLRQK